MIYDSERDLLDFVNLASHGGNGLVLLVDLIVGCQPFKLMHFIQPLALSLIFLVFSLIYYLAGGTDL